MLLGFSVACIIIFQLFSLSVDRHVKSSKPGERAEIVWVFSRRLMGLIFFGILPMLYASRFIPDWARETGLNWPTRFPTVVNSGFILVVVAVMWNASRSPEVLREHPEIRSRNWSLLLWTGNIVTWTVYLAAYEYFFRGFLLGLLTASNGPVYGILVSSGLYVLAHFGRPWSEILGSIAISPAMVWPAAVDASILNPVLLHLTLAFAIEGFCYDRRHKNFHPRQPV